MDDVVIVGAGPAGLSAGAMLRERGIDATILEQGQRFAEPWRARYDRLHLHTIRWLRIAVRTPPNIVRRDTKGLPTQLVGIAIQSVPPRLINPIGRALRRATIPDLSAYGLPLPNAPFSQFQRTGTVPVLDVGFVDAVRSGAIQVVRAVTAFDGRDVVLVDGSCLSPDAIVAATGYRPGLEPLLGHITTIGEHGIPSPQPRLHVLGIDIQLSGLLRHIVRDARQMAANVDREVATSRHPRL